MRIRHIAVCATLGLAWVATPVLADHGSWRRGSVPVTVPGGLWLGSSTAGVLVGGNRAPVVFVVDGRGRIDPRRVVVPYGRAHHAPPGLRRGRPPAHAAVWSTPAWSSPAWSSPAWSNAPRWDRPRHAPPRSRGGRGRSRDCDD